VIYELNGEVHWELSPELMRELVRIVGRRISTKPVADEQFPELDSMLVELSNFRSALECELYRMRDNLKPVQPDNLVGGLEL
jgi:hypothetical protein